MADFCKQCSAEHGFDNRDLVGLSTPEDTARELFVLVLCEGCGWILVDHEGTCVSDCLEGHLARG
jgi:hypothetical protein